MTSSSARERYHQTRRDIFAMTDRERLRTKYTAEVNAIRAWHAKVCMFSYPWRPGRDLQHLNTVGPVGWLP